MSLGNIGIYKRESPCLVSFEEINLHAHQKHVVFFFDQNGNAIDLKLLILRLGLVKTQGIRHAATTTALHAHTEEIARRDVFVGHDVLDLGLSFWGDLNGNQHAVKIKNG